MPLLSGVKSSLGATGSSTHNRGNHHFHEAGSTCLLGCCFQQLQSTPREIFMPLRSCAEDSLSTRKVANFSSEIRNVHGTSCHYESMSSPPSPFFKGEERIQSQMQREWSKSSSSCTAILAAVSDHLSTGPFFHLKKGRPQSNRKHYTHSPI